MRGVDEYQEQDQRRFGAYRFCVRPTGTIRLLAYEGALPEVVVPDAIEGVLVTALASNVFRNHTEIERIELPDSIEFAGHHLFDGCCNVRSVRMPASLEIIDRTMFIGCKKLTEVVLTASLVKLENDSFYEAPVERVCFGPQVQELEEKPLALPHLREIAVDEANAHFLTDGKALYSKDGRSLYRLVVPCDAFSVAEGCRAIEDRAFDSLSALKAVELPESLETIGRLSFAKTGLTSVHLPQSVSTIGEKAYYHCSHLSSVTFSQHLSSIGEEAFALSGIQRAELPASLKHLGFGAFDKTPLQKNISDRSLVIDPANRFMDIDEVGGLYKHDVFVELIGLVDCYEVRRGTHAIGSESFRRHRTIRAVFLPEGVFEIRADAFRGCHCLVRVDLPESLERIGARAFLDTALVTLSLSENVREIGEDALLAQGLNQLTPRTPLASLSLAESNPVFYVENGLLCEREGNKAGGDTCLLYVGPDHIIRIPDQVTQIANMALCGVGRVDELYIHDHLQSVCSGAFSTACSIPFIHVDFPEPIDGFSSGDFLVPDLSIRFRSPTYLMGTTAQGTSFEFEYYDSWVTHTTDISKFAPAGLYRLTHPMGLTDDYRALYEGIFKRRSDKVCHYFAECGNISALETLCEKGLLIDEVIEKELEAAVREGRSQATGCLLELKHRKVSSGGIDFSL